MDFINRPTIAKINVDHLRHNAKYILGKLDGQEPMAIIKADAYGHGSVFVARTLEGMGFKKFGVATFTEGMELRKEGIRSEIYVLNGITGPMSEYLSNRLYPVISELDQLKEIQHYVNQETREFSICIKFDTGMGRLGFSPTHIDEIVKLLRYTSYLNVSAVMTHLARADEPESEFSDRQYTLFRKLRTILVERGMSETNYSICNSAAILDGKFDDYQWVRPGIALYGCYPHDRFRETHDLKPVMELKTKIFSLKTLSQNSPVGYGGTFVTERESRIATLPIGYADGYPRLNSNRGHVLVHGKKAPIVGRISMDLMAIDVTDCGDEVKLYDDVTLIGTDGEACIRAEDVAAWAETISYEIICGISKRVPRVYEGL
jgi:alanine racemase